MKLYDADDFIKVAQGRRPSDFIRDIISSKLSSERPDAKPKPNKTSSRTPKQARSGSGKRTQQGSRTKKRCPPRRSGNATPH